MRGSGAREGESKPKRSRVVNILNVDSEQGSRRSTPLDRLPASRGGSRSPAPRFSRQSTRSGGLGSRGTTRSGKYAQPASYKFLTEILNDVDALLEQTNREEDPFAYYNKSKNKVLKTSTITGLHPVFQKMDAGLEALEFTHDTDKAWPASVLFEAPEPERTPSQHSEGASSSTHTRGRRKSNPTVRKEDVFQQRSAMMDDDDDDGPTPHFSRLPSQHSEKSGKEPGLPVSLTEAQVSLAASAQDLVHLTKKIKRFEDAGDTKKAATTCMEAMRQCGEDPALDKAFMHLIQKLAYTPASSSYPTQVLLIATERLMLGDDLTISYRIHRDKPLPNGQEAQGFIALFEADEVQDAGFRDLIMKRPTDTDDHFLDADDTQALRSPRGAIIRIAVNKEADTVLLSSRFIAKEGKYILRYYHEDKSIWPVAQSNVVETFIPSIDLSGPEVGVCPADIELSCAFNPYKKRSPGVTDGDSVLVVPQREGGVHKTFDVEAWSGTGTVPIRGWPVLPGVYEANYVSVLSGNRVMGKHTFKTQFGEPTGNVERMREMRLCLATEVDAQEEVKLMKTVQKSLVRICELMQLSFCIDYLSAEIADPPSPFGLLRRSFQDIDMSLPYFVAIFTHHYGFLPGQGAPEKPKPPPPAPAPAPEKKEEEKEKEGPKAEGKEEGAAPKALGGIKGLMQKKVMQIARNQALFGAARQAVSADKIMNEEPKPPSRGRTGSPVAPARKGGSQSPDKKKKKKERSASPEARRQKREKVKLEDASGGEITQVTRILTLRKSQLLKAMSTAEVRSLATSSVMLKLAQGADLIVAGNISGSMYVVVSGKFSVLIAQGKVEVAVLGPGDMVGEMSLLTGEPASATVRAKEDTSVLQITKAKIVDFLRTRPAFRAHLDAFMAERHAKNASILEKMQENRRRVQEQDNIEDDGTTIMTTYPWVFEYYNSHLRSQTNPAALRASFFELQVAYAALLDPRRATRCFSYEQDRSLALQSPSRSPSSAGKPPKHCEAVRGVKAEKAASELRARAKEAMPCHKQYKNAKQVGWMVMTDVGGALVQDFGYVLGYLESLHLAQEQLVRAHGGPQYSRDLQKRLLQAIDECAKVVLVSGPPASGKTHMVCDAMAKLRKLAEGGQGKTIVDVQQLLQRLRDGGAPHKPGEPVDGELVVSLAFAQHYTLGVDSFRLLLAKLVEELRVVFGWDRAIPTTLVDLKAEALRMITAVRCQAQLVLIVDGAHLIKGFDYEWLGRVVQHCPNGVCIVITHDMDGVPPRLTSLASEIIKLEDSKSILSDLNDITSDFLESKEIPQLQKSLESLYDHQGVQERMSPGRLRMILEYAIFNHSQTAGNYTIPVESMAKTLTLADRNMLHQAVAKGLDSKYRINGDILRFLAVTRSGLSAVELLGLMAVKYQDKHIRFSKLRDEMLDNGILILVSGIFDFSCTALRTAAHHLFYDARERGNYILMVKKYFEEFSPRSPRRIQVLGQLCVDMHANRLPFIPLINAQAQHIYQSILADVNKTRKKHPTADMDWLGILTRLLEDPFTQSSAGLIPTLAPQVLDLFAFASGAAEKEAARVRDGVEILPEARSWASKGAQVDDMVEGLENAYRDLLMEQEWFALREQRKELGTAGSRPGTKPEGTPAARERAERPVIRSWAGEDEGEELIGEEDWDELDKLSFAADCICMSQLLAQLDSRSGAQRPLELLINSLYGLSSLQQLDAHCELLDPWRSLACFEARILAFAAEVCLQRWKHQRSAILRWAVEAARVCSARLNMPAAASAAGLPGEDVARLPSNEKRSFVKSEGAKMQEQKAVLVREAEAVMAESQRFARKLEQLIQRPEATQIEDEFFIDDVDLGMTLDEENKVPAKFEDVKIRCLLAFSGWSPEAQMEALENTLEDQKRFSSALGLQERVDLFEGMALSKREKLTHTADKAMRRWLLFHAYQAFAAWKQYQNEVNLRRGHVRHHIFEGVAKAKVALHQLHGRHRQPGTPESKGSGMRIADVVNKARASSHAAHLLHPVGPSSSVTRAVRALKSGAGPRDRSQSTRPPSIDLASSDKVTTRSALRPHSTEPKTPGPVHVTPFHLPAIHADHRAIKFGLRSPHAQPRPSLRGNAPPAPSLPESAEEPAAGTSSQEPPRAQSDSLLSERPNNVFLFSTGRDGAAAQGLSRALNDDSD